MHLCAETILNMVPYISEKEKKIKHFTECISFSIILELEEVHFHLLRADEEATKAHSRW